MGPTRQRFDPDEVLASLVAARPGRLVHAVRTTARPGRTTGMPEWTDPDLVRRLGDAGISQLWLHQRTAADAIHAGQHVVMATGTASGKSLAYLLPFLSGATSGSGAGARVGAAAGPGSADCALYLAPTKALAADQLAAVNRLAVSGVRAATYDGDTPAEERRWIRRHANLVLTNPDLLHASLLPGHEHWAGFLRRLRYVVVDECHTYRGVFGSHVAAVLRRLRRVCAQYRSAPTFAFASATVGAPARHASTLCALPVLAVTDDGSPSPAMTLALWEPPVMPVTGPEGAAHPSPGPDPSPGGVPDHVGGGDDRSLEVPHGGVAAVRPEASGVRASALSESAELMARLVAGGAQTLTFARSRAGVEAVAERTRRLLASTQPGPDRIAAYRGGYLPEERRELERRLRARDLLGVAATNALELGIDIAGMDAVVMAGWPGSIASLWQQAGRAGRGGDPALAVLVPGDDPLDSYLVHHPAAFLGASVEAAVCDPDNPYVLAGHLVAAAEEIPLTESDEALFGPVMPQLLPGLCERGLLRRRPRGWFPVRPETRRVPASLRTSGPGVCIVEDGTGRVLGSVDRARASAVVHPGAVHLHQGRTYVTTALDLDEGTALVVAGDPGWFTVARSVSAFDIVEALTRRQGPNCTMVYGAVTVRSRVTSFTRRLPSGRVLGQHPLTLPEHTVATQAVWWTTSEDVLTGVGLEPGRWAGALHAAEHAAIGLLPLVATADRWDIGGVSTVCHPDTEKPTVMVYDGYPGGAGFAERGFAAAATWLSATRDAVAGCPCSSGCPSCVQSPKCGNGNRPLDKDGAVVVLDLLRQGLGG
ncbi:MAG TPA: DEAD/DEAH box helicase [Dermatophilaceae bacterium]|nr:DEAD/DEAH box helicase [Dermatophilaceae bacterium]